MAAQTLLCLPGSGYFTYHCQIHHDSAEIIQVQVRVRNRSDQTPQHINVKEWDNSRLKGTSGLWPCLVNSGGNRELACNLVTRRTLRATYKRCLVTRSHLMPILVVIYDDLWSRDHGSLANFLRLPMMWFSPTTRRRKVLLTIARVILKTSWY